MSASTIRVLLADDHELVRTGIRSLLTRFHEIQVIGEANSGEDVVQLAQELVPHVILMDVIMPGIGGLEATRRVLRRNPEIKIIAITACDEDPFPSRLLQAGASGYLTKGCAIDEIVLAIHKVNVGQRYLSPQIAQQLALKHLSDNEETASPFDQLSARELQIMIMITSGQKVQKIAEKLCLSPKTVNSYRYRLFEKLKIKSDVDLTHLAMRHNMLENDVLPS